MLPSKFAFASFKCSKRHLENVKTNNFVLLKEYQTNERLQIVVIAPRFPHTTGMWKKDKCLLYYYIIMSILFKKIDSNFAFLLSELKITKC